MLDGVLFDKLVCNMIRLQKMHFISFTGGNRKKSQEGSSTVWGYTGSILSIPSAYQITTWR